MIFQIEFLQAMTAAPMIKAARLCALTLLITGFSGSAMAFTTFHGSLDDPVQQLSGSVTNTTPIAKSPSPSMADSCFPLLKSIHQTSPVSAMDRTQRSAGQAAALGFVFGVRFALSPPNKPGSSVIPKAKTRLDIWQAEGAFAGNRHALAVSSYRHCQKEKALQSLDEFRWKR